MTPRPSGLRGGDQAPALLSVAYGGGGLFAIAFGLGVVDAFRAAGVPIEGAEAIGTSAGSWVVACTAVKLSFDELCEFPDVAYQQASELLDERTDLHGLVPTRLRRTA